MGINDAIIHDAKCGNCDAEFGTCDCWEKCTCGCSHLKTEKCANPKCALFGGETRLPRVMCKGTLKL